LRRPDDQPWAWDPATRLLTTAEAAVTAGVPEHRIRKWASRKINPDGDTLIAAVAFQRSADGRGRLQPLYLELDVLSAEARARSWRTRAAATRRRNRPGVAPRGDEVTSCDQSG
jgi:hypothetical protein